jgi:hypothetical protein
MITSLSPLPSTVRSTLPVLPKPCERRFPVSVSWSGRGLRPDAGFSSLLFGIGGSYSVLLAAAVLLLAIVALLACCVPARQAAHVDR